MTCIDGSLGAKPSQKTLGGSGNETGNEHVIWNFSVNPLLAQNCKRGSELVSEITMWHEARKQEKKLRDTMVDYRKRAERRRVHYEKMVS